MSYQGRAISGLVCNLIMFAVLITTGSTNNSTIFTAYVIVGNVLMAAYYYLMIQFFDFYVGGTYKSSTMSLAKLEAHNAKLVENDKTELLAVGEANNLPNSPQQEEEEDVLKNHDINTWSYGEIFNRKADVYIGMTVNFTVTLLCFPVLTFRIDMGIPDYYRFAVTTLIFNVGDTVSRYFYVYYKFEDVKGVHLLNLAKFAYIPLHLWAISASTGPFSWVFTKGLVIFSFAFISGYLCMAYFEYASKGIDSVYDRNRAGNLLAMFLEAGLILGSVLSVLWPSQ